MCVEQDGSGSSSSIKECVCASTGSAGLGMSGRAGRGGFGGRRTGKNKRGTHLVRGRFQPKIKLSFTSYVVDKKDFHV